jgi:uncharacterized protein
MSDQTIAGSTRPTVPVPAPLEPLLRLVQARLHPVDVWLFGSRARGNHREDSDWDLLAVLPDDASESLLDPIVAWEIVGASGVRSTLLATRRCDLDGIWGRVNTLGYVLSREGVRLDVG